MRESIMYQHFYLQNTKIILNRSQAFYMLVPIFRHKSLFSGILLKAAPTDANTSYWRNIGFLTQMTNFRWSCLNNFGQGPFPPQRKRELESSRLEFPATKAYLCLYIILQVQITLGKNKCPIITFLTISSVKLEHLFYYWENTLWG